MPNGFNFDYKIINQTSPSDNDLRHFSKLIALARNRLKPDQTGRAIMTIGRNRVWAATFRLAKLTINTYLVETIPIF